MSSHTPSARGKPTATIYQNETDIVIIFSPVKDDIRSIRGASVKFENSWCDGGACGLSGFRNEKERTKFIIENNLVKRGTIKLIRYCYAKHKNDDGSLSTCMLKQNHKGKHISEKGDWEGWPTQNQ